MITRESFLAGHVCKPEPVETADGRAWVRPMTAGERDRWETVHLKAPDHDFRARLLASSLCDEAGRLVFTEDDVPALSELPFYILDPLCQAAARVNRMGPEETEALRKNLPGPNGDSSSVSLVTSE
jgi:hypothetical protein